MSASCTNIASDERPRMAEAVNLKRQGSERMARQKRIAYFERINQAEAGRNGSSQQSPRRAGRRTASNQSGRDRPLGTSSGSALRPDSARRNGQCMRSASDVSPNNYRRIQEAPSNFPEAMPELSVQNITSFTIPSRNAPRQGEAVSVGPTADTNQPSPDVTEPAQDTSRPGSSINISLLSISSLQRSNEESAVTANRVDSHKETAPESSAQSGPSPATEQEQQAGLSLSNRSAVRLRAEARRSSILVTSSSEEDMLDELSQNTGSSSSHGHPRQRRRRSQGSGNFTGGSQPSQESNPAVCHAEVNEEEMATRSWPQENGRSADNTDNSDQQLGGSGGDADVMTGERGDNLDRVRVEETSGHDSAPEHISESLNNKCSFGSYLSDTVNLRLSGLNEDV